MLEDATPRRVSFQRKFLPFCGVRLFTALSSIKLHPFCVLPFHLFNHLMERAPREMRARRRPLRAFCNKMFSPHSTFIALHFARITLVFLFSACECASAKDYLICSAKEMSKDKNKIDFSQMQQQNSFTSHPLFLSSVCCRGDGIFDALGLL
jgi:hypothetical protein